MRLLGTIIDKLPIEPGVAPLRRLTVLASHSHPNVKPEEVEEALDSGVARAARALAPLMARRLGAGSAPEEAALRARFYPWYVETKERREPFETDLADLLRTALPAAFRHRLDSAAATFRDHAASVYADEIACVTELLTAREAAQQELSALMAARPTWERHLRERQNEIKEIISAAKSETAAFIDREIVPKLDAKWLRIFIEGRFQDAKEAEREASNAVLTELRLTLERFIEDKVSPLTERVQESLGAYPFVGIRAMDGVGVAFDARGAFLSALVGGGTFGALAAWASVVAGGSNLGAYLLVPRIVSLLATLGISFAGGTAGAISLVSALGGPVGIGIGIAVSAGLIAYQVLGRAWQTRLADRLAQEFAKRRLAAKIQLQCGTFWDDTLKGFALAAKRTDDQFLEHISRLQAQQILPEEQLRNRLARLKKRADFISFLPWTPLNEVPGRTDRLALAPQA